MYVQMFHECVSELIGYSSSLHPASAVVRLVQCADNHSLAAAGMDELPFLQVDSYMAGFPFLFPVVEEHQVALLQVALGYFPAVFGALVFRAALQFLMVYLLVNGISQTGTVCTSFAGSTVPIGDSQPFGGFHVKGMIVFFIDIHFQADGSTGQFLKIIVWSTCRSTGR